MWWDKTTWITCSDLRTNFKLEWDLTTMNIIFWCNLWSRWQNTSGSDEAHDVFEWSIPRAVFACVRQFCSDFKITQPVQKAAKTSRASLFSPFHPRRGGRRSGSSFLGHEVLFLCESLSLPKHNLFFFFKVYGYVWGISPCLWLGLDY